MKPDLVKIREAIEDLMEDDHDDGLALAAVIVDRVVEPLHAERDTLKAAVHQVFDCWADPFGNWTADQADAARAQKSQMLQRLVAALDAPHLPEDTRGGTADRLAPHRDVMVAAVQEAAVYLDAWGAELTALQAGAVKQLPDLVDALEQAEAERDDLRARLTGVAIHAGRLSSRYDDPHGTTEMGQVLGDLLAAVGAKNMTEAAAVEAERDALKAAIAEVRRLQELTIAASCRAQAIDQAHDTLAVLDRALNAPTKPHEEETDRG